MKLFPADDDDERMTFGTSKRLWNPFSRKKFMNDIFFLRRSAFSCGIGIICTSAGGNWDSGHRKIYEPRYEHFHIPRRHYYDRRENAYGGGVIYDLNCSVGEKHKGRTKSFPEVTLINRNQICSCILVIRTSHNWL